jgi:hypothetical protein
MGCCDIGYCYSVLVHGAHPRILCSWHTLNLRHRPLNAFAASGQEKNLLVSGILGAHTPPKDNANQGRFKRDARGAQSPDAHL